MTVSFDHYFKTQATVYKKHAWPDVQMCLSVWRIMIILGILVIIITTMKKFALVFMYMQFKDVGKESKGKEKVIFFSFYHFYLLFYILQCLGYS